MTRTGEHSNAETGHSDDPLLGVVVEILETEGYDAVQLREVARRARASLATIYKRYPTREVLILAALQAWVNNNRYSRVAPQTRAPGTSLHSAMMELFRLRSWLTDVAVETARFRRPHTGDANDEQGWAILRSVLDD